MTSPFLAALAGALAAPWPAAAEAISAYPAPGVRTANPHTQISLRGAPIGELGDIVVRGARSGRHRGHLRAHSDGNGASFVPSRRFAEGERVTVRTTLDVAGARHGDFKFRIARRPPPKSTRPADPPGEGSGTVQRFVTRPDLVPPTVTVTKAAAGRAPGLIFIGPKGGRGQEGVMILDDAGQMVWFKPARHREEITDFRAQTYRGRPVLTWWQGQLVGGDGRGVGLIYDDRYRLVRRVRMGNGYRADLHEFELTPNGTALMIAYDPVIQDLRRFGGQRRGIVIDGVVQEIDIATGLVLFEWHSVGDIGLQDTRDPVPEHHGSWDYVHLNSVALDSEGDFIISARHTSAIYKVDRATADVVWRLGGRRSSFRLGPGATFREQHDARPQPDGTITVFDNATPPPLYKRSRAITLRLDTKRHTATLVRALTHPGLLSSTQGNVSVLPNGNTFVGWGSQRWFS
ncbi:MAG TPA: arylsulfotransferase family protein, partial [Solirubrobacter sp.]|nr:arylsulfotransferase family protein [Solirubrobacter sp.]